MNDRTPTEATLEMRMAGLKVLHALGYTAITASDMWPVYRAMLAASPLAPAAEPVAFAYRNWRGEVSERHVRIIGIRFGSSEWHPEPQLLLRAFDLDKGEEREFAVNDIGPHPLDAAAIRAEALEEHIRLLNTEAKRLLDEAEAMPTGFEQDSRGVAMILEARALDEAADALRRLADKGEAE